MVVPSIRAGRRVVVVGHENNLRGLLMHLEGISEAAIPQLEIPRAVPLRYQVYLCTYMYVYVYIDRHNSDIRRPILPSTPSLRYPAR